jgi:pimeloyl-ACP methyl ester carboxylesterase
MPRTISAAVLLCCLAALLFMTGCTSPAGSPAFAGSPQPSLSAEDVMQQLRAQYPAPGELLEIDGTRMHIRCQGSGSPAVIMEAGSGDCSLSWALVQQNVSQFTRVCAYDRPGHGWSDPAPGPLTAGNVTGRLHTLLFRAGIPGPYVMAGHSLGGVFVRSYAHRYPDDVAGMVLVDPGSEWQAARTGGNFTSETQTAVAAKIAELHELGSEAARGTFARNLSLVEGYCDPTLPPWEYHAYCALWATEPWFWDACADDGRQAFLVWDEVRRENITQLGNIPLVVISSGRDMSFLADPKEDAHANEVYRALQREMAAESPQGRYLVAENSGHNIQIDQPDVVTGAIRSVVQEVRDHQGSNPGP